MIRAERRKAATSVRVFESRCVRPDSGDSYHAAPAELHPFEKEPPEAEIWESVGWLTVSELWNEVKAEIAAELAAEREEQEREGRLNRSLKEIHHVQGVEIQWINTNAAGEPETPMLVKMGA